MLYWGSVLLKQLYNLDLKLKKTGLLNLKFLCLVFIYLANNSKWSLDLNKTNMSSTNLLYTTGLNSGGEQVSRNGIGMH